MNAKSTGDGERARSKDASASAAEQLHNARAAHEAKRLQEAENLYRKLIDEFPESEEAQVAAAFLSQMSEETELGAFAAIPMGVIGFGFWAVVGIAIAAAFGNVWSRNFLASYWIWIGVSAVILVVASVLLHWLEARIPRMDKATRNTLLAFGAIPLIMLALGTAVLLPPHRQVFVFEIVFIVVVCIIPAATYYLFLKTRRPSILNDFIGNLSRLGLLGKRSVHEPGQAGSTGTPRLETPQERHARIDGYFQRFEAMYGELRFGGQLNRTRFTADLIRAVDAPGKPQGQGTGSGWLMVMPLAAVRIGDIFRANLVIPLGLITVLSVIGWLLVLQPVFDPLGSRPAAEAGAQTASQSNGAQAATSSAQTTTETGGTQTTTQSGGSETTAPATVRPVVDMTPELSPLNFAFLGAYFFGTQMLFRRFVSRDLGPNAYLAFAVRIILATIAVWVLVVCLSYLLDESGAAAGPLSVFSAGTDWPAYLLVSAFVVGVFPRILWQFITALLEKVGVVDIVVPPTEQDQELTKLDGLTIWHEARLQEEDVENVPNMASVDIVDIMLRTQIPAERLICWIDQAILLSLLRPGKADGSDADAMMNDLRKAGARTASQLVANYDADGEKRASLEAVLKDSIHAVVGAVQIETNFDLVRAWRGV